MCFGRQCDIIANPATFATVVHVVSTRLCIKYSQDRLCSCAIYFSGYKLCEIAKCGCCYTMIYFRFVARHVSYHDDFCEIFYIV